MNVRAQVALLAAAAQLRKMREPGEIARAKFHYANQIDPLPSGALDLIEDLQALERARVRLEAQITELSKGRGLPA